MNSRRVKGLIGVSDIVLTSRFWLAHEAEADEWTIRKPPDAAWELWIAFRPECLLLGARVQANRFRWIPEGAAARNVLAAVRDHPLRRVAEEVVQAERVRLLRSDRVCLAVGVLAMPGD